MSCVPFVCCRNLRLEFNLCTVFVSLAQVFILEMNEEEMCSLLAISQLKLKQKIHGIEPLVLSSV